MKRVFASFALIFEAETVEEHMVDGVVVSTERAIVDFAEPLLFQKSVHPGYSKAQSGSSGSKSSGVVDDVGGKAGFVTNPAES